MKKIVSRTLVILTAAAMSFGCVSQVLKDCGNIFDFDPPQLPQDPDGDLDVTVHNRVETITLYVFDSATGRLVHIIEVDQNTFASGRFNANDLPPGKYDFVAWANSTKTYDGIHMVDPKTGVHTEPEVGVTTITDLYMVLKTYTLPDNVAGDVIPTVTDFDNLFYASAFGVEITATERQVIPLEFKRNVNTINVHFTGLDLLPNVEVQNSARGTRNVTNPTGEESSPLRLHMIGKNGRYRYDNTVDEDAPLVRYEPQSYVMNGTDAMSTSIKTMRLDGFRNRIDKVWLYVQNPEDENVINALDVIWAILQVRDPNTGLLLYNSQDDIDREIEFDIDIQFIEGEPDPDGVKLDVKIFVNDFEIEILEPMVVH